MKKLLLLITLFTLLTQHTQSQWVQQTVPVSKPIQGIKFIDSLTGWACTGNTGSPNEGYVLHTTNGGTNWFIQLTNPSTSFNAIAVINANVIYAGGSDGNGRLFKSTNGGTNWTDIGVPSRVTDMVFLNQDSGYYCADFIGADVRTTTDGGATWQVRIIGIASQTQRIFFLNYNTGFCGAGNNLYITTNAGLNWILNNNFSQSVQSIFFLDQNTGWCGLGLNRIYFTSNGGLNWIQQTLPPNSNSTVFDIFFNNSTTGYAGTSFDKIFKTVDGGLNWGYQADTGASYRISMLNDLTGWTGSLGAKISRTTNGGGSINYVGINSFSTEIPSSYKLYQNFPNPFNPVTTIKVDIAKSSNISFIIYDLLGSELYREDKYLKTGSYSFTWDASNYSSGTYFYRLISDKYTETRKMILIK
jgi:photosystem II stability/assembly factor-like uncharacterized protein